MTGTCAATKITIDGHGRHRRSSNLVVIDPRDGHQHRIGHPRDLERYIAELTAAGHTFDGRAYDLPPGASVDTTDNVEVFATHIDPATLRGKMPADTPTHTRHVVAATVAATLERWGFDRNDPVGREMKATLAASLRRDGWPEQSAAQLRDRLVATYPELDYPPRHLPDGARTLTAFRAVTPGDLHASVAYLQRTQSDERARRLTETAYEHGFHRAAVAKFAADGSIVAFGVVERGGPTGNYLTGVRCSAEATLEDTDSLNRSLKAAHRQRVAHNDARRAHCFGCSTAVAHCECSHLARDGDVAGYIKQMAEQTGGGFIEHRWGGLWARRPTAENHLAAKARTAEVRAALTDELGEIEHQERLDQLGPNLHYNLALFAEQTGIDNDTLRDVAPALIAEMSRAVGRVERVHGDYATALADEFDNPDTATVRDVQHTEVYLGRDGIYPFVARRAWRAAERYGLDAGERDAHDATRNQVRYLRVSRLCRWEAGVHTPLLGDHNPMFIDTGFAGSIPHMILTEERGFPRRLGPTRNGPARSDNIRLFNATDAVNSMRNPYTHDQVDIIEADAKPDLTARAVDQSEPTGAVEQLIYRQIRNKITADATDAAYTRLGGTRPVDRRARDVSAERPELKAGAGAQGRVNPNSSGGHVEPAPHATDDDMFDKGTASEWVSGIIAKVFGKN